MRQYTSTLAMVTVVAACMLAPASALAQSGGLSEVLTSGARGASPDLTLRATLAAPGTATTATASVGFEIDGALLSKRSFDALAAAPSGTEIGYVMTDLTGRVRQLPLRKTTVTGTGAAPTVQLTIDTPDTLASVVGPTLPATAQRMANGAVRIGVDLRSAQLKLVATQQSMEMRELDLTLFGTIGTAPLIVVPTAPRVVTNSLTVRECSGATCQPGLPQRNAAAVTLPKTVTLDAPVSAVYGRGTLFSGLRFGNDPVQLWVQEGRGIYLAVRHVSAATYVAGTFDAYAPLRSIFNADHDLVQPATGRYVIADIENGTSVVLGIVDHDTSVRLAQPKLRIHHIGSHVRVWVTVPGGNGNFTTTIKLAKMTVAVGHLRPGGTFTTLIPRPTHATVLRVFARVRGAATILARRPLLP